MTVLAKIWSARQGRRWRFVARDHSGVALVAVLLAIFILTVVVAALVLATMGETGLSFDQSRSSQALHLAEGGAYRVLADLRHRLSADLGAQLAGDPNADTRLQSRCTARQGWRIIADYAYPTTLGSTDWTDDVGNRRAVLALGTAAAPLEVRDAAGTLLGSFYATIYVRSTDNQAGAGNQAHLCQPGGVARYQMWFDYFIVSTGTTRNAQRTVCLKNPGNLASCGEWLASGTPGSTAFDTAPAAHGFVVLAERASYSRWALMINSGSTWLVSGTTFLGPVHSNSNLAIWGNPDFESTVTQVAAAVAFGNCGSPTNLPQASNPPCDQPGYRLGPLDFCGAACLIGPPAGNSPIWAVLDQSGVGVPPNSQIRQRTTALANNGLPVPNGIYFMDECGGPVCGGIFVQGNASNVVLQCDPSPCGGSSDQAIIITAAGQTVKFVLESSTNTRLCTGPPAFATCTDLGRGFNGMLYVNGSIVRTPGNPLTGLYGVVQRDTRLTIAADGELWVTNHLVYASPPSGPLDPVPNVLGLYAWCSTPPSCGTNRNVTVDGVLAPDNLYIDASVLTPWGKFWVSGWNTVPDKGPLRFLGGTVQNVFGEWGGFLTDALGNITGYTGYGREMTFDQRFLSGTAPPFFPLTNQFTSPRFPRLNPDPLYDRPLWEELVCHPQPPARTCP